MKLTILLLTLAASISTFAMEVRISCLRKNYDNGCFIYNGKANFLKVNGNPITFYQSQNCSQDRCDWIGQLSPYAVKEGSNNVFFEVRTMTNNQSSYTDHYYEFFFSGNRKFDFRSPRVGSNTDSASKSVDLSLSEIDPALYNEYLALRREYEQVYNGTTSPQGEWDRLQKESNEIRQKIAALRNELATIQNKNFDEIDQSVLDRLGIAQSQILLLTARQEELHQFQEQGERSRQQIQSEILARHETLKARAKTYHSELPDLPKRPDLDGKNDTAISPLISETVDELIMLLRKYDEAIASENFDSMKQVLARWHASSDYGTRLYTETSDLNDAEKNLLYNTLTDGTSKIFKDGVTKDLWKNTNKLSSELRHSVDEMAVDYEGAKELRNTLNFRKIDPAIYADVTESLSSAQKLSLRIKTINPGNEKTQKAYEVASASLKSGFDSINRAIKTSSADEIEDAKKSLSIGLMVLDVGLDLIPYVGAARSAYELFTGENMVTGEKLTTFDASMSLVGLFGSFTGYDLSKIASSKAKGLFLKISNKLSDTVRLKVDRLKTFPQVDNLIDSYMRLKRPIVDLVDSEKVNKILSLKYKRFERPAFAGNRIIKRFSESGESFCRFFSLFKLSDGVGSNKIDKDGGFFVFRCADVIGKTSVEIMDMASIPVKDNILGYYMVKIEPRAGSILYEGSASKIFGKEGGAIQVFIDTKDKVDLERVQDTVPTQILDLFKGFN
jgi:hypothetical protein